MSIYVPIFIYTLLVKTERPRRKLLLVVKNLMYKLNLTSGSKTIIFFFYVVKITEYLSSEKKYSMGFDHCVFYYGQRFWLKLRIYSLIPLP